MVLSYFQTRQESGISPSQLSKDATAFRLLAERIGKQNIVPKGNSNLVFSRTKTNRMQPKTLDRAAAEGIRTKLVERQEKTGLPEDRVLVAAYDLRSAFGLRAEESLMAHGNGTNLEVIGKGGRFRSLPAISSE